jgi:glycosyltransferase involved in cell wall biosynthesis
VIAFSLLLPIYALDSPEFLVRAFHSSVHEQSRPPDEVVLVRDGPVPQALEEAIAMLAATSRVPVVRVDLDANVGLGQALHLGLAACTHEIVARIDADDVSVPVRFAVQLPLIESGLDLVGSALLEFDGSEDDIVGLRTPPTEQSEIRRWSRFADPFNHPTVVYRRSAVLAAGGYRDLPLMEDYWLFARMIANGATVANVAEPLVKYRIGEGAYRRRGGWHLLRSEITLQRRFRASGFVSRPQFVRNLAVRGGYRLVPEFVRRQAYRRTIARRGER